MYKILLACAGGMSTTMMVKKMKQSAEKQNIEVSIEAVAESRVEELIDLYDAVLLGPQISYLEEEFKEQFKEKNKPISVIDLIEYGTMNGEAVLEKVLKQIGGTTNE